MEPSRPAMLGGIAARMNTEQGLPLAMRLHAFESALLTGESGRKQISACIAESDLIVASHVMMDEEADALERMVATLTRPDAVIVVVSSVGPLMRLTRIGKFSMNRKGGGLRDADELQEFEGKAEVSGLRALFKRIIGDRDITPYLKDL